MTDTSTVNEPGTDIDLTPANRSGNVVEDAIGKLQTGGSTVYSSLTGDDWDSKLLVLSAVQKSEPLSEHIGRPFYIKNIVIQPVEMTNPVTGEVSRQPRIILLTPEGEAFHAISNGILKAVENFVGILGQPSRWPSPVRVTMTKGKARVGNYYTLELTPEAAAKK